MPSLAQSLFIAITSLLLTIGLRGAEPNRLLNFHDFPPSLFEENLETKTWHKPDPILQQVERDLDLSIDGTNQAEKAIVAEIGELRNRLLAAQAAADANDPFLQIYGQYVETAHDWVMKHHLREFNLANQYFRSNSTAVMQRTLNNVVNLIDMALYRELASNTNFTQLFRSNFDTFERKLPGQFSRSYARNDSLIGFQVTTPPKPVTTFEAYLSEIDKRYELVMVKLEQIHQQNGIPAEVITGWMYGDLYRVLDGCAQQYVMLNTSEEINKLRQELHRKDIELSELRASGR